VLLLIEAGSKVNAEDEKGTTPLLLAGAGLVPDNINGVNKYERICSLYWVSISGCTKAYHSMLQCGTSMKDVFLTFSVSYLVCC